MTVQQPQANEPWTVPTALACRPAGRVVAGCMLHMLRSTARLTRKDMAAAAGVSEPAIVALEAGAGHAHPALIDELLRRYGPHAIEHAAGLARLVDDKEDTQSLGTVMDLLPGWRERLAAVLPGAENADEAGVHDADEDSGKTDNIVGKVSLSSARCRADA